MLRRLLPAQLAEADPERTYHLRLWRAYDPEPLLVWEGSMRLTVARYPARPRGPRARGALVHLVPAAGAWAEYEVSEDAGRDGQLLAEDWGMEVYAEDGAGIPLAVIADPGQYGYFRYDPRTSERERRACRLPDMAQLPPAR